MVAAVPFARAATALLTAVALIVQVVASARAAAERGWDVPGTVVNFFSLFTVQANIIVAVVLAWCAVRQWSGRDGRRDGADVALACATTYAIWTALVYNAFLRSPPLPEGTRVLWSNEVVHVVIPVLLVVDLLLAPRRRPLSWRVLAIVPLYPLAWVAYTLIRGPLTPNPRNDEPYWYPYTFFDPALSPAGYLGLSARGLAAAAGIVAVASVVILIWRVRAARAGARTDTVTAPSG